MPIDIRITVLYFTFTYLLGVTCYHLYDNLIVEKQKLKSKCWCKNCKKYLECHRNNIFICKKHPTTLINYQSNNKYYEMRSCKRRVRFCGSCHTFEEVVIHELTKLLCKDNIMISVLEHDGLFYNESFDSEKNRLIIVGDQDITNIPEVKNIDIFNIYNCPKLIKVNNDYISNCQWLKKKSGSFLTDINAQHYAEEYNDKITKLIKIQKLVRWKVIKKILSQKTCNDIIGIIGEFYL